MSAAETRANPRWFATAARLEHDEDREQPAVVCHVRPDLGGCLTAAVWQASDGGWRALLFHHPDSHTDVTRTHKVAAERLAAEHSDRLTAESFFAEPELEPEPEAAQ